MKLEEVLKPGGRGVIATASKGGEVNTAVYAFPTWWTRGRWPGHDGRQDVGQRASEPPCGVRLLRGGEGFRGARLTLSLLRTEDSGEMLAKIRQRTAKVSPGNPEAVRHVAYFKVVETRPLV